jgi:CubicO group peptidase (beta-lactamase class C family)
MSHSSLRRAVRRAALVTCLAGAPLRFAGAQLLPSRAAARIDSLFARFTAATPGCALLVRRAGTSVYGHGYGLASLELGVPISTSTVFDIGSTSKQFTAASVALLALDGKLSLDDDIRKYVPELPDLGARVTLRHLLTHTSGWRDYIDIMSLEGWDERDRTTDDDALNALRRQRALNFQPGTEFRYSNTGYFLMSLVVRRVSGQSLADFAQQRLFEPLGMHDTRYLTDTRTVVLRKATAYAPGSGRWNVAMSNWEQIGDGGVQTSVEDLAKWDANLASGTLGGRPLLDLLHGTTHLADGAPVGYGLGLMVDEYHGHRRVHHGGAWAGYRAMSMRFPDDSLSVLLTCNAANANTMSLATGVADVLLSPATVLASGAPRAANSPSATVPLASLAGVFFDSTVGQIMILRVRNDSLAMDAGRGVALLPLGDNRFRHPVSGSELRFQPSSGGSARWVRSASDGHPVVYERVEAAPSTLRPADYAGTYASAEAGTEWTIVARDSGLVAQPRRGDDVVLRPVFRDAFAGAGLVRFERDANGKPIALTVSTRGVHGLRFTRVR